MSEGTGSGFLDETFNAIANIGSLGLVGFGKEGFDAGVGTKAAIDVTKEVTGAAAAEEANEMAREQFESDRARIDKERQDAIKRDAQTQLSLSQGAARARTSLSDSGARPSPTPTTTDFLGL